MDNGSAPATRQDLQQATEQLRSETKQDFEQLRSEMNHGYNDLAERITDSETRILKAFYAYAETNQARMAQVEGNVAGVVHRVHALEERLLQVEKRLNMPPAA